MATNVTAPTHPGAVVPIFASAARTATPTDVYFATNGASSVILVIDTTAAGTSPSTVFTIQGYDPDTGTAWTLLASAAITGTGDTILRVAPGLTASANVKADEPIPAYIKINAAHGNATSHTYQVNAHLGG